MSTPIPPARSRQTLPGLPGAWRSCAAGLLAALLLWLPQARAAGQPNPGELVGQLRRGGYVLVMRHAQSPEALPSAAQAEPDNPQHERQLSAAGKAAARELGAALRTLHIPIGPIYSSPTYRARETIALAGLAPPQTVAQLAEGARGMASTARRSQNEWLQHAVGDAPPSGRNTLIVTHTPNIVGAFGRSVAGIKAGEMLVFEPHAGRGMLLGRISVDQWRQAADSQH